VNIALRGLPGKNPGGSMPDTWTEQEKAEAELDKWLDERRRYQDAEQDEEREEIEALELEGDR
jgi:hypothetical protein